MGTLQRDISEKLRTSLERRGVAGTITLIFKNIWWLLRDNLVPSRRKRRRQEREFDRQYGIDTNSIIQVADLAISGEAGTSANYYEPTPAGALESILRDLPIANGEFTFIDVGSGMGRAVFVALGFPFRCAMGVEISSKLHEIALDNLGRYRNPQRRCQDCRFVLGDATTFEWPDEPLVLYLYSPFGAEIMEKVLNNLGQWLEKRGRELYVIYYNPDHKTLLDNCGFLQILKAERAYSIYHGTRRGGG